jgi:hypothetical protein
MDKLAEITAALDAMYDARARVFDTVLVAIDTGKPDADISELLTQFRQFQQAAIAYGKVAR